MAQNSILASYLHNSYYYQEKNWLEELSYHHIIYSYKTAVDNGNGLY